MSTLYIWVGIIVLLGILYTLIGFRLRKLKEEETDRIYFEGKTSDGSRMYEFYRFFSVWLPTRHYIQKRKCHMDIYSPGDEKEAALKTMQIFFVSAGVSLIVVFGIICTLPKWTSILILFSGIYFADSAITASVINKQELALLNHLLGFLSDIRHEFQSSGMIEESIEKAVHEKTHKDMKAHAQYLLEVINAEDMEEKVKDYMAQVPNPFLKEFLTLCVTVTQFGDFKLEGQSLFLTSIRNLKKAIHTEILRRKKQNHLFGGYSFIIAAPIFTMPLIPVWAMKNMPVLGKFYNGSFGILYPLFCFFITLLIYQLNLRMQEDHYYQKPTHPILYYLCEIPFLSNHLHAMLDKNRGKGLRMEALLQKAGDNRTPQQFLLQRCLFLISAFIIANAVFISLPGRYYWYDLLASIGISIISYIYPLTMLYYQKAIVKGVMLNEIMQFHSIIYMLSVIPQMTSEGLLDWMENFAVIFKASIRKCRDSLCACEEEAMEELRESENYEPFQRLIENLQTCDKIGVEKAFDELGVERIYFQEERKEEGEISLDNKGALGTFLSMIPTMTIIVGYLFAPFIIESFSQFSTQLQQLNQVF